MTVNDLKTIVNQKKGQKQVYEDNLLQLEGKWRQATKDFTYTEKAQLVIQEVAQKTQQRIKDYIEDIVSMAIDLVFTSPYLFKIDFVVKRNKTEAELYFLKGNDKYSPMDSSGYGVVDIAAFALRVALLTLKLGNKRKVIILDEPFRFLSKDLQCKAGEILQKLSRDLGIQFIMITHNTDLIDYSDKTFELKKQGDSVKILVRN